MCGYFWPPTPRSRDTAHAQYDFWPKHVLLNNAHGIYIVDRAKQYCKHLIFGMLLNNVKPEQQNCKFSLSGGGLRHVTLTKFCTPSNISPKRVKLYRLEIWHADAYEQLIENGLSPKCVKLHIWNLASGIIWTITPKWTNKISVKGRGLGHVTFIKFGTPSNISPKCVKLHIWNLACRCIWTISRKWTNKMSENGRGLRHVTLIICSILWDISKQESLADAKVTHDSSACTKALW